MHHARSLECASGVRPVGGADQSLRAKQQFLPAKADHQGGIVRFQQLHFREEIDEIATRLRNGGMKKVACLDGRTSNGKRFDALNDKNDALILQIQTGCEGLNLQENYSEIYFISPHWNPAVEDQAIARCHRIGQTKTVYVERFEMCSFMYEDQEVDSPTVDNYVTSVQDDKRTVAHKIMNAD